MKRLALASLLPAIIALSPAPVLANPTGPVVTTGNITISGGPGSMTINQADMRGIIHWQDFSIGAGEITQFVQPGANAATLNRVTGGIPSSILGTLQANGHVFLINPNGILVGPTGVINTAGFIASTLDVPDAEFLAGGDMNFSGSSLAGVVNLGTITATAGDVALLGNNVMNAGTINAPNGVAVFAAGNDILYSPLGDEKVVVRSSLGGAKGVENSGTINAAQAELKAAGGNVYGLAVNNTGTIAATGIATRGGRVILSADGGTVQNSGSISAKNADGSGGTVKMNSGVAGTTVNSGSIDAAASDNSKAGGTVEVTGGTITLTSTSQINASGANGGTVIVGGVPPTSPAAATAPAGTAAPTTPGSAAAGATAQTPPAQRTTIEAGSRILANATSPTGSGGSIVVWSEQQTIAGGVYEARAGTAGGDGGLIETSGKLGLTIVPGTVASASAPAGRAGTWLLDPAGVQVTGNPTNFGPPYTQNANVNNIFAGDLITTMTAGTSVVIQTSDLFPVGNRDIVIDAALPLLNTNPAVFLTLLSAGGIAINQPVGGVGVPMTVNMLATGGNITVSGTGSVLAQQISATASGAIDIQGTVHAQNGNATLVAQSGGITFAGGAIQGTKVDLRAAGAISSATAGTRITASQLVMESGPQGIGTPGQTLGTSVGSLEARLGFVPASPVAGGVFIENTGVTTLNIGGVDAGLSGVQVPIDAAYKDIFITTTGSLLIGDPGGDRVTGPQDVGLFAGGDLKVFNNNANSVRSHFGTVSLSSGGQMEIGEFFTARFGNVRGFTGVNLMPSGPLVIRNGSTVRVDGTGDVFIMGGDQVSLVSGAIQTSGGDVTIFTGPGALFSTSGGSASTITTTLNPALHGDVTINSDIVDHQGLINAGTGYVNFKPADSNRSVDLGTDTAGKLSLTNAELGRITASNLNIETGSVAGDITITAPLSVPDVGGLGLFAIGRADFNASLNLGLGTSKLLLVMAQQGIGGTNTAAITSNAANFIGGAGAINLPGPLNVTQLNFNTLDFASFGNPANEILRVGDSEAGAGLAGINIGDGTGNLTINGNVVSNGALNSIKVSNGNLFIDPGASITAPSLQIDISNGNFINLGGPNAITIGGLGRLVVYERDPFGGHNKGGLLVNDFTTHPVSINDANNDPLGIGSVFYYASLTQAPPVVVGGGTGGRTSTGTTSNVRAFTRTLFGVSTGESIDELISRLLATPFTSVIAEMHELLEQDPRPRDFDQRMAAYNQAINIQTGMMARGAYVMSDQQIREHEARYRQEKVDAIFETLGGAIDPSNTYAYFQLASSSASFDIFSLSPDQIRLLGRDQLLRMAVLSGGSGFGLTIPEQWLAHNATMTPEQFAAIVKAGGGDLTSSQFAALVAAGAGNLTLNQMVAAGGLNMVAAGGLNMVAAGGLNLRVVDRAGNLISNDAGSLTIFELAKLIGQDGGSLIGQDGGSLVGNAGNTLVGNAGNTLVGNAGNTLVGNAGNTLLANIASMIGQDGGSLIGLDSSSLQQAIAAMTANNPAGVLSHNGGAVLSHNGGALINLRAVGVLPSGAGGMVPNAASVIGQSGSAVIGQSGSAVIGQSGSAFGGFSAGSSAVRQ